MKKYVTLVILMVISLQANAQIDKIVGQWVEVRHFQIDTLDSGRKLLNKDVSAFLKDYKGQREEVTRRNLNHFLKNYQLSEEYTTLREVEPLEEYKLQLKITKEQDYFLATAGEYFNKKITYREDLKEYAIDFFGFAQKVYTYIVLFDEVDKKLVFKDILRSEINFYEFVRKE